MTEPQDQSSGPSTASVEPEGTTRGTNADAPPDEPSAQDGDAAEESAVAGGAG